MRSFLFLLASLGCLSVTACSSSSGGETGSKDSGVVHDAGAGADACEPFESDADLETPTVSFATDVLPIFQRSCGIAGSTCHGTTDVPTTQQRPYLGFFDGGTDAAVVVKGIVGVASYEDPSGVIVKASDPTDSFMMNKLDGTQCLYAAECAKGSSLYPMCGQQMPYSSPALDVATRDTIRRWIAQGATNN